ncbi:MAG: hypothetical protein H6982_13640 [Chromatiales bacterium]|nr:hypothetical protein [Chromatiales bacterium]
MSRPESNAVREVACVGAGTVGGGWAAVFLARGLDVRAWDPAPDGEAKLRETVASAWPAMEHLGLAPGASQDRLRWAASAEAAVDGADFVQESAPDDEPLKVALLERLDAAAPRDTVIASSSSKFLPSRLAARCKSAERVVIGHPFVPVYLVPLVEVVGGEHTSAEVMRWACDFYTACGKKALPLKREIEAYLANRLQQAVLAEAMSLVEKGVCDWDDVEEAVTYGPGYRWAVVGPMLHRHLGGGRGGVRHMIAHFGWKGPPGSEVEFIDAVERRWSGMSIADLERWRDARLLGMLDVFASYPDPGKRSG